MSKHLSQLNDLRMNHSISHSQRGSRQSIPGECISPDSNSTLRLSPPRIKLFDISGSLAARRRYSEHLDAAREAEYRRERGLREFANDCDEESGKNAAAVNQLRRDAQLQAEVAQSLAQGHLRAAIEAIHKGKSVVDYTTNVIRYIESGDRDADTTEFYVQMVRRLAKGAMISYESAAMGVDFDPSVPGGEL